MAYWLMKSEPSVYSWSDLVKENKTAWSGVRNYEARNNMQAMKKGDQVFFYHSNEGKEIVGLMEVVREAYPDPEDETGKFVLVDVKPVKPLKTPVTLATLKADKRFADLALIKKGRISVTPVGAAHFQAIAKLGGV
ncbi:MAG: EVE domain-containing protein [Rhodospirillales bacterium]